MSGFDLGPFTELPFPEHSELVYVLCYSRPGATEFRPFYIGETGRGLGRFGDYLSAQFTASTDFRVGRAVRRLREHGSNVTIFWKASPDRAAEEKTLIKLARGVGYSLLNDVAGYDYRSAKEPEELTRVHNFVDALLTHATER